MLLAAGGSGRKSLARLATYIAEQKCFSIEIHKNYRISEFREDLKELYRAAGCTNKPTTFLFDETQIKYETFVEDINNILTSGEVPNLFSKEEIGGVVDEARCSSETLRGHLVSCIAAIHEMTCCITKLFCSCACLCAGASLSMHHPQLCMVSSLSVPVGCLQQSLRW